MRFNQDFIKILAKKPGDKEGGLYYKSLKDAYKSRWLKLNGNLLFLFKVPDGPHLGDKELVSVYVLDGTTIQEEPPLDQPFLFSIRFQGEGEKKHMFSCQTQQQCTDWVSAITSNNYRNLKEHFDFLRLQMKSKTGQDPIEINRRNQKIPRRTSREFVPLKPKCNQQGDTSSLPTVTLKTKTAKSNYTVGASAFYQSAVPELKASFNEWETFD